MSERMEPVLVRVANAEALIAASLKKEHGDYTFRTIVLNTSGGVGGVGSTVRPLCAADLSRELVIVQAFTNDVVLCESQGKAQDPANAVAGLPNPEGFLLKASTATLYFPPVAIPGTGMIWVTAASYPAIVSAILVNRVRG